MAGVLEYCSHQGGRRGVTRLKLLTLDTIYDGRLRGTAWQDEYSYGGGRG
jgi:hypothetical protein